MDRREFIARAGSLAFFASPLPAFARMGVSFDHAVPGVGTTVSGPVRELRLYFGIGVPAALASVQITNSAGVTIPTTRPVGDPSDQRIVIVHFSGALSSGTYKVSWRFDGIPQRPASGTFYFNVS
ncbi:MAG TPA: copper resistance protein CopC [Methylocella sp.]|nr:copper resistance protein CopC [Methylocella sp.]